MKIFIQRDKRETEMCEGKPMRNGLIRLVGRKILIDPSLIDNGHCYYTSLEKALEVREANIRRSIETYKRYLAHDEALLADVERYNEEMRAKKWD